MSPCHGPRIAPVGRWIRRLHIDELPQLFNVLLSQRYAQIYEVYADSIQTSRTKLDCDRRYIANLSLGLDLGLLARTVNVVLTGHGSR